MSSSSSAVFLSGSLRWRAARRRPGCRDRRPFCCGCLLSRHLLRGAPGHITGNACYPRSGLRPPRRAGHLPRRPRRPTTTVGTPITPAARRLLGRRAQRVLHALRLDRLRAARSGAARRPPRRSARCRGRSGRGPPANACRNAASANDTALPICVANVAARIANSVLPGHGSGQRTGGSPYSAARRSTSAHAGLALGPVRPGVAAVDLEQRRRAGSAARPAARRSTEWIRSAARYE